MQYVVSLLILVTLLVGGFAWLNRPLFISVDADIPSDFPDAGFSHLDFEYLLRKYVDADGNVDYDSCPVMRPTLPTGAALQQLLATATTEFVSDPKSVRAELRSAQEYDIVFSDYDWSLNGTEAH